MALVSTKFSYQKNGFRFINRFELSLPIKFQLPFGASVDLNKVVFGLCGGMCFSALDYFNLGDLPPQTEQVKQIDFRLLTYLCERQLDSLKISTLLKVFEWMLMEDRTLAARLSRYEIPKLRRSLDKGEPVVLALIRVQNLDDPTRNHQVLATGYEVDPTAKKYTISLYDPNHPGKDVSISVDLSDPKSGMQIKQSTGEFLRGFFIIPYTASRTPPASTPRTRDLAPRSILPFQLSWPVDSRIVNQHFGENPDLYKPFHLPGHEGLDLYALSGANVYAAASGEVTQSNHPKDHPYGLQIRIKHTAGNTVYHTVYAHLSKSMVHVGQKVKEGELIGLADNTGNSFGAHLHLTLKIDGANTPGYPAGIVDPWPYLNSSISTPELPLPGDSGLVVYTTTAVNLRSGPDINTSSTALLPSGEALSVLGEADKLRSKIGIEGEWLQVKTSAGTAGYVAAWLVQDTLQAFPPSGLVVYPFDEVNLRSGPRTTFNQLATLTMDDPLVVLGDRNLAQTKLGKQGEWLQVQTPKGQRGFVAAWLVHSTGQIAPSSGQDVFPTVTLNVRARPTTDGNVLTVVSPGDALTILGDKQTALAWVGLDGKWLNVRTPDKFVGYVAAWLVRTSGDAPSQPPTGTPELLVYPLDEINMRAQPSVNSPRVGGAHRNEPLQVVEADLTAAKDKIGKADMWIFAQKKDGTRGWLAAWFLSAAPV